MNFLVFVFVEKGRVEAEEEEGRNRKRRRMGALVWEGCVNVSIGVCMDVGLDGT